MADEFFGEVLEDFYVSRARDMCMSLPSLITPTVAPALTSQPSTYTFVPSKALPALTTEDPALTASPTPQSSDASNRPTPIWTPSSSGPSTSGMSKVPQSPFVPTATPRVESSQSPTQLGLSPRQPQSIPTTNNFPNQSIRPSQILLPPTPRPFTTASGRPSFNQSITPIPTVFPQGGRQVFGCSPEGDIQLEQLFSDNVSGIPFNVSYRVESLAATEVFLEELELQILVIALAGALQCNNDGSLFNNETPNVPMNTANTGEACEAPVSGCEILQTEFQVWVNNNLLSDVAAFLGYLSLREKMDDGGILDIMPILDNIEYIRPLPLLPPIVDDDEDAESPGNDDKATNRDSVSPWTLGAVSAMCKLIDAPMFIAFVVRNTHYSCQNSGRRFDRARRVVTKSEDPQSTSYGAHRGYVGGFALERLSGTVVW